MREIDLDKKKLTLSETSSLREIECEFSADLEDEVKLMLDRDVVVFAFKSGRKKFKIMSITPK